MGIRLLHARRRGEQAEECVLVPTIVLGRYYFPKEGVKVFTIAFNFLSTILMLEFTGKYELQ